MPLKIRVKKKLPSRRVSVSLPGELYAKLELCQRLLGGGVGANDVIAEALRVCFERDKDFRRAWEEECARRAGAGAVAVSRPAALPGPPAQRSGGPLLGDGDRKGLVR